MFVTVSRKNYRTYCNATRFIDSRRSRITHMLHISRGNDHSDVEVHLPCTRLNTGGQYEYSVLIYCSLIGQGTKGCETKS